MHFYSVVQEFESRSSPGKSYIVKRREDGVLTCNCPAWIFKKGGERNCVHLRLLNNGTLQKLNSLVETTVVTTEYATVEVVIREGKRSLII